MGYLHLYRQKGKLLIKLFMKPVIGTAYRTKNISRELNTKMRNKISEFQNRGV
jgi:hypothetical protein